MLLNNDKNIICNFIKERRGKMSDKELKDLVDEEFSEMELNYSDCALIDAELYPEQDCHRGYWRECFGFPKDGDKVEVSLWGGGKCVGIVEDSAFFTMKVNINF